MSLKLPVITLVALLMSSGCADDSEKDSVETVPKPKTEMNKSLGLGYKDGFTDGMSASHDMNANWMWLWTKDEQYQTEYERGWSDGRSIRKMKDEQKRMQD